MYRNAYSATRNHPFRSRFLRTREYDSSEDEEDGVSKKNEQSNKSENKPVSDTKKEEKESSKENETNKSVLSFKSKVSYIVFH